jgi:hypothetical protein
VKRIALFLLAALCVCSLVVPSVHAQSSEKPPMPTFQQVLPRNFVIMHTKIVEMVRDFPEDKFDYKPHADSRSFLQEVWHVTAVVQLLAARGRGEKLDTRKLFSDEGKPRAREEVAAALEKATQEAAAYIEKTMDPQFISTCTHAAEHYGHLVGIYRSLGLVPPASRKGYKGVAFERVMAPTPPIR